MTTVAIMSEQGLDLKAVDSDLALAVPIQVWYADSRCTVRTEKNIIKV